MIGGESNYIRERAREIGMNVRELADRVGVSHSYMSQAARGHRNMGVKVQARLESALEAPVKVAPAQCADVDREAVWERMNAHGMMGAIDRSPAHWCSRVALPQGGPQYWKRIVSSSSIRPSRVYRQMPM